MNQDVFAIHGIQIRWIDDDGAVTDVVNQLTVFMVVRADSHESAARLFEGHPHMSIFVCDGVEVMPVLGD